MTVDWVAQCEKVAGARRPAGRQSSVTGHTATVSGHPFNSRSFGHLTSMTSHAGSDHSFSLN